LGKKRPSEVKRPIVKALLADCRKQGLSANTVRLVRATLCVIFGEAVEDGLERSTQRCLRAAGG
jgi:hypothetical protein